MTFFAWLRVVPRFPQSSSGPLAWKGLGAQAVSTKTTSSCCSRNSCCQLYPMTPLPSPLRLDCHSPRLKRREYPPRRAVASPPARRILPLSVRTAMVRPSYAVQFAARPERFSPSSPMSSLIALLAPSAIELPPSAGTEDRWGLLLALDDVPGWLGFGGSLSLILNELAMAGRARRSGEAQRSRGSGGWACWRCRGFGDR